MSCERGIVVPFQMNGGGLLHDYGCVLCVSSKFQRVNKVIGLKPEKDSKAFGA